MTLSPSWIISSSGMSSFIDRLISYLLNQASSLSDHIVSSYLAFVLELFS